MAVEAAVGPAHVEGERALQQTAEDLHLVHTAVLGNLKPLHEKLQDREHTCLRG